MKVAILGWGSLIWDLQSKHQWFQDTIDVWQAEGPTLPIEFCRISSSRERALTLVLQPTPIGSPCRVSFAVSKRGDLADVIADIAKREDCGVAKIGCCLAAEPANATGQYPNLCATIQRWLDNIEPKLDAVVWTDLENNFEERSDRMKPFSVGEALIHLKRLPPGGRSKAAEYVWRAPDFVQTKLRRKIETWPCVVPTKPGKRKDSIKRPHAKTTPWAQ